MNDQRRSIDSSATATVNSPGRSAAFQPPTQSTFDTARRPLASNQTYRRPQAFNPSSIPGPRRGTNLPVDASTTNQQSHSSPRRPTWMRHPSLDSRYGVLIEGIEPMRDSPVIDRSSPAENRDGRDPFSSLQRSQDTKIREPGWTAQVQKVDVPLGQQWQDSRDPLTVEENKSRDELLKDLAKSNARVWQWLGSTEERKPEESAAQAHAKQKV